MPVNSTLITLASFNGSNIAAAAAKAIADQIAATQAAAAKAGADQIASAQAAAKAVADKAAAAKAGADQIAAAQAAAKAAANQVGGGGAHRAFQFANKPVAYEAPLAKVVAYEEPLAKAVANHTILAPPRESTVSLSDGNNLIHGGSDHTMISGGFLNTYEVTAIGTNGGLDIADFSVKLGDVLNLHDILSPTSVISSTISGSDLLISVGTTATNAYVVADLHGMAGASLSSLIASHNIMI